VTGGTGATAGMVPGPPRCQADTMSELRALGRLTGFSCIAIGGVRLAAAATVTGARTLISADPALELPASIGHVAQDAPA